MEEKPPTTREDLLKKKATLTTEQEKLKQKREAREKKRIAFSEGNTQAPSSVAETHESKAKPDERTDEEREAREKKAEAKPEQSPKTPEVKTFSAEFIKRTIASLLEGKVDSFTTPNVEGVGQEITVSTAVTKSGFNVKVKLTLGNAKNNVEVKEHTINAKWPAKGMAEEALAPQLEKVPELVRTFVEEKEAKKVEKIEIEGGELKVTFRQEGNFGTLEDEVRHDHIVQRFFDSKKTEQALETSPDDDLEALRRLMKERNEEEEKSRLAKEKAEAITRLRETIEEAQRIITEETEGQAAMERKRRIGELRTKEARSLIESELNKYEKQLLDWKQKNDVSMVKHVEAQIELLKLEPIKYFKGLRKNAEEGIQHALNYKEYTEEEKQRYSTMWTREKENYQRVIDALEAVNSTKEKL